MFRRVDIIDANVQMHPWGMARFGPVRRAAVRDTWKRQLALARPGTDDGPVVLSSLMRMPGTAA